MKNQKSFSLIEVLVFTFLALIIFFGIFGAYQLGMQVVGRSKNKITATAIANGEIEKIRNLSYGSIGVKGGFPDGVLEAATTTFSNNIEYRIETRVDYVVDSADGISLPDDDCPNDYKRLEIKVSWSGRFPGEVKLSTDVAPKNLAQECETLGGILSVSVFDAYGNMVSSPLIEVKDPATDQTLKTATPSEGKHYFSLATSTYKVVVSKSGYSSERTYGTDEITTPEKPHPMVLEGQLTETSFSIDKVSSFSVDTLSPWGQDFFADSFNDESKISEKSNVIVGNGEVNLATSTEGYFLSGYLISTSISTTSLINWDEFSFSDLEPINTDLRYQIYYASGTDWYLIPDTDLAGNSTGFDDSPVDLSNLSTTTYSQLKIRGNFSTNSTTTTPTLYDWQISWITSLATPIPNVTFNLRGDKIIGLDINDDPVYKYSATSTSNSNGHVEITNLEWDNYTFSINPASGLDLVSTDPSPQPISLSPNTNLPVKLYLDAQNSLLLTIQDATTSGPIFSATARLFNLGLGYDKTQYTNEKGQTYFIPLEIATYNLEVQAAGYSAVSTTISISGDETETIKLEQVE
jgi:hypothetical protein